MLYAIQQFEKTRFTQVGTIRVLTYIITAQTRISIAFLVSSFFFMRSIRSAFDSGTHGLKLVFGSNNQFQLIIK
jgi:hypothetical protein